MILSPTASPATAPLDPGSTLTTSRPNSSVCTTWIPSEIPGFITSSGFFGAGSTRRVAGIEMVTRCASCHGFMIPRPVTFITPSSPFLAHPMVTESPAFLELRIAIN